MPTLISSQLTRWRFPFWEAAARRLRAFGRARRGAVAIEFAIIVPVLVALILGGVDMGRYALLHQKAQRTAATVADLLAGTPPAFLIDTEIDSMMASTTHVMQPFVVGDNVRVIASMMTLATDGSGAYTTDGTTTIDWQRCWVAPGSTGLTASSDYGTSGNTPSPLPPGFQALPADTTVTVIVAEVVYQHQFMFVDLIGDETPVHVSAVYLPRASVNPADLSITDNC